MREALPQPYAGRTEAWKQGYLGWSYLRGETRQNPFTNAEARAHFEAGKRQAETDYDNERDN